MKVLLLGALALLLCGSAQALDPATIPALAPLPAIPEPPLMDDASAPLSIVDAIPGSVAPRPRIPLLEIPDAALEPPAVAALASAGSVALILAGLGLYSRLARSELLDHKRREALLALVRSSPGMTLSAIAKRSALAWGTAVYHLDRLERAGFLVSERNAGRRCYFVATGVPRDARASLGTLQQETTRSVATFGAERPGATQSELCEGLGMTASAASKQVSKLESAGLVRREREWRAVRLHPEPRLSSLLAPIAA